MKVSTNWLQEFVKLERSPREVKSDLTMIGLNTESLSQIADDTVLDIEVTTNRPDCLSHYGVARELAAHYGEPLKKLDFPINESVGPSGDAVSIEIADPDLCARYCGRVVRNVQVGPSPAWLVKRLEAIGQRSINNVADATNYVLMELGHPLHAFDLSRLGEHRLIVRRAQPGEILRTLDGVDRMLTRENLVIADCRRPVALAGVMGGEDSGITTATRDVLLESAWFEPVSIRRTSKSHGMHTEASHRFERGADILMARLVLDRTATLIQEIAGGEILEGAIDVYPRPWDPKELKLAQSEITRVLGTQISAEDIERILRGLGFEVVRTDEANWRISAPSFRVDISREVDLVEEVARHVGYDHLPSRVRPGPPRVERDATRDKLIATTSLLVALGFHEMIATSMVDPVESERFSALAPVVLANPLSQDASAMRTSTVLTMVRAIRWNLDRDTSDIRFFELGKTYNMSANQTPEERQVLTLGASGHRRSASVYDRKAALDFFDLKGAVEAVLGATEVPDLAFEPCERLYLEPGRSGRMLSKGSELAVFGKIREAVARDYKLRQDVWVAEIDFERLLGFPLRTRKFQPISKFPAVERDFSLVVPGAVSYDVLSAAVHKLELEEMRELWPIGRADHSQVPSLPAGHYTLLLRATFQSQTHTLTSDELAEFSQRLIGALEKLGVRLRA